VSVLCQGCWSNWAIIYIGGTDIELKQWFTMDTKNGELAAHWTLWHDVPWEVTIEVTLPEGLDPLRWGFIFWISADPKGYSWGKSTTFTVQPGESVLIDLQLVDTSRWWGKK
jgi:hypothetical protein